MTHTKRVSEFYRERRDVFERAMKKHLDGLAEWNTPEAGMFFWCVPVGGCRSIIERRRRFKLCLKAGNEDSAAIIQTKAFEKGVLALPGTVFLPNGRKTAYVRASFSVVREEDIDEAVKRLGEAVLESLRKEPVAVLADVV